MSFTVLFVFLISLFGRVAFADELDDINRQLDELRRKLELSEQATRPLEIELKNIEKQLFSIRSRVEKISEDLQRKAEMLERQEENLVEQEKILRSRVFSLYKNVRKVSPLLFLLSAENFLEFSRVYFYQNRLVNEDKSEVFRIFFVIRNIEQQRAELADQQQRLSKIKQRLDSQSAFLAGEIDKAKKYQSELKKKIAELSRRQKELLAARSGVFTTSIGDVPLADDPAASPDFNPPFSPAFAAFSFGAYTHRKGLSQYGAKGRAESGQNYREILKAYFGREPVQIDTGGGIQVQGYGELDFEGYYLLGIAEMPHTFPFEALKAQAVAARTYAYRYKSQGRSICTTQSCQVFLKSKADNPPEEWRRAVEETRGQILEGVEGFYSSTTGGYLITSGWDTKCGNQSCWPTDAYEKIAGSPWFYKAWYRKTYRNNSDSCGRAHPWLTEAEFADILNAWVVRNKGSEQEVSRILPVTIKSCPISSFSASDDPFSMQEMKDKAAALGGAYSRIYDVSVVFSNDGFTSMVKVNTDRGVVEIDGQEFKDIFNLRAPGYISIRNKLFNIAKK